MRRDLQRKSRIAQTRCGLRYYMRQILQSLLCASAFMNTAHAIGPMQPCQVPLQFYRESSIPRSDLPRTDLSRNGIQAAQIYHYQREFGTSGYYFVVGNTAETRVPDRKLAMRRALVARSWLVKIGVPDAKIFAFADLPDRNASPVDWPDVWGAFITFCQPKVTVTVRKCIPKD